MAEDVTLLIKLQDQASPKVKRLTQSTKRLEQAVNGAQNSIRRTNKGIRDTGRAADRASQGVNKLGKAVRGLAAGFGVFQAGKFVIFKTAELERQTKSLEVLTGSLGNARSIIKELQQFGAVTPFTSSELIETAKRLKAFGFQTEEVVDVTKRLADVAGATGADLGGIATAFGQIQAKGRLQGEELLQLQERGVRLQDELQKMYGLTADEFRKALEGGRISADAVNLALQNITETGGKYAGGAIAQSDTLAGKFSTLIDGIETISRNIGEVLSPALKGVLGLAVDVVNSINAAFNAQKRLSGFGISDKERNRLFRQAGEEAKQIALLRGGGKLDPGEFTRIRSQRFSDLINQFGFETGQLIPEISAPQAKTKLPSLLKSRGGGTAKTPEEQARETGEKRLQTLKDQATVVAGITEEERRMLELEVAIEGIERQRVLLGDKLADKLIAAEKNLVVQKVLAEQLTKEEKERIAVADRLAKEMQKQKELVTQIGQTIEQGIVNGLLEAKSASEAFSSVLNTVSRQLMSFALGSIGGTEKGSGSGIFGAIADIFRANGGPVRGGRSYIVGERGPEVFTPGVSGGITPNSALGGANVTVNVDASGSSVEGDSDQAAQLGKMLGAAVQAELVKQKRPGGLLAS